MNHAYSKKKCRAYCLATVAYNEASNIQETMRCVVHQTIPPKQWLIVSDGSTDGTDAIVKRYAAKYPWIKYARLPEEMQTSLNAMKDGAVSDPSPYAADPTKPGFHILYRKRIIAAHTPSVDDDYKQLEQMAAYEKKQRLEQEWVQKLRKELYWETR